MPVYLRKFYLKELFSTKNSEKEHLEKLKSKNSNTSSPKYKPLNQNRSKFSR